MTKSDKWEYMTSIYRFRFGTLINWLNKWGQLRWQLVYGDRTEVEGGTKFYFKREVIEDTETP